jgi:hypothetical protein
VDSVAELNQVEPVLLFVLGISGADCTHAALAF